jgi:hypothetical protein
LDRKLFRIQRKIGRVFNSSQASQRLAETRGVDPLISTASVAAVGDARELKNGPLRDECPNANRFLSIDDARHVIEAWPKDYSRYRPHSSPRQLTRSEHFRRGRHRTDEAADSQIATALERSRSQGQFQGVIL